MPVYVPIDVHKRFCQLALLKEQGAILYELKFENPLEGAQQSGRLTREESQP